MRRLEFGSYRTIDNRGERIRIFIPPKPPVSSDLSFSAEEKKYISHSVFSLGRLEGTTQSSEFGKKLWNLTKVREFASSLRLEGLEISIFDHFRTMEPEVGPGGEARLDSLKTWLSAFDLCLHTVQSNRSAQPRFWDDIEAAVRVSDADATAGRHFIGQGMVKLAAAPPSKENTANGLKDLQELLFEKRLLIDPLDTVAIFIGLLSLSNPFGVKTGPIGRLVCLAILHREGLMRSSVLSLSSAIEAERHHLTEALSSLRNNGDWEAWISGFAGVLSKAADETVRFNRAVSDLHMIEKERVAMLGRPAESINKILDAVYDTPVFSSNQMVSLTGLTPATVNKSLAHMEGLSIIREVTAKRRGRIFEHLGLLKLLTAPIR